ncbi:hypothetical protein ACCO45_005162 [Purpureocillium lilacinum]|uniref:Uncharacterized protein n=1 Tax=Purpureocillium lilacinum TaxID=33203 RepID=A0ACC4DUN6_PURLI
MQAEHAHGNQQAGAFARRPLALHMDAATSVITLEIERIPLQRRPGTARLLPTPPPPSSVTGPANSVSPCTNATRSTSPVASPSSVTATTGQRMWSTDSTPPYRPKTHHLANTCYKSRWFERVCTVEAEFRFPPGGSGIVPGGPDTPRPAAKSSVSSSSERAVGLPYTYVAFKGTNSEAGLGRPGEQGAKLFNKAMDMPGRSQEDRALRQKRAQPNVDDDAGASAHDAAQTWRPLRSSKQSAAAPEGQGDTASRRTGQANDVALRAPGPVAAEEPGRFYACSMGMEHAYIIVC